ncbi:MAG: apolipoprotein N-acyltransferase [bacterium]
MKSFIALIAGAVSALAFAPFGWWPLGLIGLAVLFDLWRSRRGAAWYGFAYGVGLFGAGTLWIYVSLYDYGGMAPAMAALCVLLLVLGLALAPAGAGLAQAWLAARFASVSPSARAMVIMPVAWLLFEWLRGWLLGGFPWLTAGYAMLDTPLAGWAPLGGVYLVSLLTLITVGVVLTMLRGFLPTTQTARRTARANGLAASLLALCWLGGAWLPSMPALQSAPRGEAITVAIIQNNVPLTAKWDRAQADRIVADYLAQSARHADADVVVWPEAAVPAYLDAMPPEFARRLRAHPADFLFGALTRQRSDDEWRAFNSVVAVGDAREDDRVAVYHKRHLVPFGEFLPLPWLFRPLLRTLQIPMSDFTAWRRPQSPLRAAGTDFAVSICYEDAFPREWRDQVPRAGVLLNLSEDMWFGDSLAPHQRLQMARFRALESARPMIRASNNGLSAVIDRRGEVVAIAPQFARATLSLEVQPRIGATPYIRHGDAPALALALLLLATTLARALSRGRRLR